MFPGRYCNTYHIQRLYGVLSFTRRKLGKKTYDFSMYVNQADFAQECTDGLGVYFSNGVTTAAAGWGNAQINNATTGP